MKSSTSFFIFSAASCDATGTATTSFLGCLLRSIFKVVRMVLPVVVEHYLTKLMDAATITIIAIVSIQQTVAITAIRH